MPIDSSSRTHRPLRLPCATGYFVCGLLLAATDARAQLCSDEPALAHQNAANLGHCACFVPGDQAGPVFNTLPASAYPLEILEVRVGWVSQFGGGPASTEQALHIYQGGLPNPGVPVFTLPGPTLNDGAINTFDLRPSGPVTVNSGPFTVTVEFVNQSSGNPFQAGVAHDNNGCQATNAAFVPPSGWIDACAAGVPGDWVFEVVWRPLNCARCPAQTLSNHAAGSGTALPNFVPGEQAGASFTIPAADLPAEITDVRVGWSSQFGGTPPQLEQAIHVYHGGLPNPGAPSFTIAGPTLVDGQLNAFNLSSLPGAVVVSASPVTVAVEFTNQSSGNPFAPSVEYDSGPCVLGRNPIFTVPGGWSDACLAGVPGNFVFELVYKPIACPGAGRVPDGRLMPGTQMTVGVAAGGKVSLAWDASCKTTDTDYHVYEGTVGSWYSHTMKVCGTSGTLTATFTPAGGNRYYLVVPTDGTVEGSYGVDAANLQRPAGAATCTSGKIGSCP